MWRIPNSTHTHVHLQSYYGRLRHHLALLRRHRHVNGIIDMSSLTTKSPRLVRQCIHHEERLTIERDLTRMTSLCQRKNRRKWV